MRAHPLLMLPLLPLLAGGCATRALWTQTRLDAWNQPAADPNVRLFDAGPKKDFLVVYDEYSERHDAITTRAYFLKQSQPRVAEGRQPHFANVRREDKLPPVPVLSSAPLHGHAANVTYAVLATNRQAFTLYSGGRGTNCNLPVYNDGWGRAGRIALTPVAVVVDLTIIGGVFFLEAWGDGGLNGVVVTTK